MYTISEVSEITSLPISTLRYYENLGILLPNRDKNNYRIFSKSDIEWITFIKRIKKTGMDIKTIQLYSELRSKGDTTIQERINLLIQQKDNLLQTQQEIECNIDFINKKISTYKKSNHVK